MHLEHLEIKPIFRTGKYRDGKYQFRVFRRAYPYDNPTNEVEAIFLQLGSRGFWVFRNYYIWSNWPCQA